MKIAISSTGKDINAEVDPRFGRCRFFLVVDSVDGQVTVLDNGDNVDRAGGAGIKAAELVSSSGAEVLLTGNCGPKAFNTLTAAGLKIYTNVQGRASDAIDGFRQGKFVLTENPNVDGHW